MSDLTERMQRLLHPVPIHVYGEASSIYRDRDSRVSEKNYVNLSTFTFNPCSK
jgi:hypothetical protein